jgi:alpha-L-rhamnosidase
MRKLLFSLAIVYAVTVYAEPGSSIEQRTTVKRLPIQQEKVLPVEMVEKAPGCYFVDFGKADFGGLEIEIKKPEAGRKLVVHMGEAVSAPKTVNRKPGGSIRYWTTNVILQAEKQVYVVPLRNADNRLMSKEVGPVMPFRYVEIENAPALEKKDVRQVAAFYPFNKAASDFKCSDPKLNAIWEMCKHTMKVTSFGGVFIDGDRERLPYEADAYINQLGWYCCTDDLTLPRYSHEHLILKPTWPTEWIMFSVLMAWEDYCYTGDAASLKEFYGDLKAKTLIALARPDGLISTVEPPFPKEVGEAIHIKKIRDIVDWPGGERDGCEMKPVNTVVNVFHCHALQLMANLAAVMQKSDDEKMFRDAAVKVLKSIEAKLVDPATGLYVDGEVSKHSSLHANMFPLAFGLVPADRLEKVRSFVKSRGMACSVYGAQFLLEALFDGGMAEQAMALMTADNDRSFTHMIDGVGTTVALEAWDSKYKPNLDWNHAWGAAPANILPRKVLGVEPLEPGFAKILIQPRPGKLEWAEGYVPSKAGKISVRFDQDEKRFQLKLEIPSGATARVGVPKGRGGELSLDGKPAKGVESGGFLFLEGVDSGKHEIILR